MKKIILFLSLFIVLHAVQAQSVRVGVKGAGNSTWLLNKNVFDTDETLDHDASFGMNAGVSATYMFNDMLGLSLDIFYSSVNQHYKGEAQGLGPDNTYVLKEKLRYVDLPLLFKLTSEKGPYFEIGPKLSILTQHREEFDFDDSDLSAFGYNRSVKNDFNPLTLSLALGFGVDINIAENMFITVGLRLAYGLGDTFKRQSQDELEDQTNKKDDHTTIIYYSSYKDGDFSPADPDRVFKYKATHTATGGLMVGYTYSFGGKSK